MTQHLKTPMTVESRPGYNSWPMIQALGRTLVCAYSRGKVHSTTEYCRGSYVRTSADGGRSWSPELELMNYGDSCDVVEAKGLDGDGRLLLWVKHSRGGSLHDQGCTHSLHRSADGKHFMPLLNCRLDPMPVQIMSVVNLPGKRLLAFWFSGSYGEDGGKSWGTLLSEDHGLSWRQRTVFSQLSKDDWPTETSGVYLGHGRILAIARKEGQGGTLFQLESEDDGQTWRCLHTGIDDILESTPCLFAEPRNGLLRLYYYQRGAGLLKCRVAPLDRVFGHPQCWSASTCIARGGLTYHAGNVNGTAMGNGYYLAYYTGEETQTDIVLVEDLVP